MVNETNHAAVAEKLNVLARLERELKGARFVANDATVARLESQVAILRVQLRLRAR